VHTACSFEFGFNLFFSPIISQWSKGKVRDKKNHAVVYDNALLDKVVKEVPKKMKVITVYTLVENYKINASLARRTIQELVKRGLIKAVAHESHMQIYVPGKP
jgi:small subunit ribosomal protein S25e